MYRVFGKRNEAPPDKAPGGRAAAGVHVTDVADALRHAMKLMAASVAELGGPEEFLKTVRQTGRDLSSVKDVRGLQQSLQAIRSIQLPVSANNNDPSASPLQRVLLGWADALVNAAHGLSAEALIKDATEAKAQIGQTSPAEITATLERLSSRVSETVAYLKPSASLLRDSVAELVGVFEGLVGAQPDARERLQGLKERLTSTDDVTELESLRENLLKETSSLVEETRQLESKFEQARDTVNRAQAQVEDLQAALEDANQLAVTDPLTGLGNRRAMHEALKKFAKSKSSTGVIALDIDFFKKVNDTYGHAAGDACLRLVAEVLDDELRGSDVPYRIGGEEFVVLLGNTNQLGSYATAERLREAIEITEVSHAGHTFNVTVSMGVATWEGGSFAEAHKIADERLYRAKSEGRNRTIAED